MTLDVHSHGHARFDHDLALTVTAANAAPRPTSPTHGHRDIPRRSGDPRPAALVLVGASGARRQRRQPRGSELDLDPVVRSHHGRQGSAPDRVRCGAPGTTMHCTVVESPAAASPVARRTSSGLPGRAALEPLHDFVNTVARNGVTAVAAAGTIAAVQHHASADARFLLKAKFGFDHVASRPPRAPFSWTCRSARSPPPGSEELAALGVPGDAAAANYCRGNPVTRAQMAVFLLKASIDPAFVPPLASGAVFADVAQEPSRPGLDRGLFAAASRRCLPIRCVLSEQQQQPPADGRVMVNAFGRNSRQKGKHPGSAASPDTSAFR